MRRRGDGVDAGNNKRLGEHHDGSFGVYMSHKIQKLREQNDSLAAAGASVSRGEPTDIFRGIHVYVDGYTMPSKEELRQLVLLHGGGFEHYDTSRVTHIIATHLPAFKLRQFQKKKNPLPVVHPAWIVQSIQQTKLLPVQSFLYAGFSDPTQSSIVNLSGTEKIDSSVANEVASCQSEADQVAGVDTSTATSNSITTSNSSSARKLRTNSTRDGPEFVRHFFAKSRLHHIGTWRATFQQKADEFLANYRGKPVTRASPASNDRVILHVDMDCFFVAVALIDHPEWTNVPVAVAHSELAGSSEISSCNYLARAQGLCAGMLMQTAKEKCPDLHVLPYHFDAIQRVSFQIYTIFFSHTPYVQAISCDEACLEFGKEVDGWEKAATIRNEIFEQTQCVASVGVSYNVLLAKVASKKAKPNGIFQITDAKQAQEVVSSLKVRDLPGVGRQMGAKLQALGVQDVTALARMTRNQLVQSVGKASGDMLYEFARGIDVRPLSMERNMMRKSVSAVVNFGIRFDNWKDATQFLQALGEELSHRLRQLNVKAQCLTLLIKKRAQDAPIEPSKFMGHGICDNFSKSSVLAQATDDHVVIGKTCIELLRQFQFPSQELRGVGMQATRLMSNAPHRNQQSGQLFKAWLNDTTQLSTTTASSGTALAMAGEASDGDDTSTLYIKPKSSEFAVTSFSQINKEVLDELPESLQREIVASYGKGGQSTGTCQVQSKRQASGKARLRRKPPARNIFSSKSNNQLARHVYSSNGRDASKGDALDDIRMSQVDSEVYHSLPYTLQREIDRHAIKRRPTSTVAPLSRPPMPLPDETGMKSSIPSEVPSIEVLYVNLVESLQLALLTQAEGSTIETHVQSAAFDALYSRILVEIEKRALDKVLRMLRYVRRKSSSVLPAEIAEVLKRGFNQVLKLVNQDIQRCFNGVLASRLIAPL